MDWVDKVSAIIEVAFKEPNKGRKIQVDFLDSLMSLK